MNGATRPNLQGRTALVTGASRGLGRAIAERLWRSGASVFLVARSRPDLAQLAKELSASERPGQSVRYMACDLADDAAVHRMLEVFHQDSPTLDVLVNNAAIVGPIGKVWENDWGAWTGTIQVNLLAPVALCRAAAKLMLAAGRGRIINLSGGGATGPRPCFSAYAAAKTALVRFSEVLAVEVAGTGVTVNCVAPGAMNTAMAEAVRQAGVAQAGKREFEQAQAMAEGKSGIGPQQATDLVLFLASDASDGITGRLISAVWDKWAELPARREELASSDIYTLRRIVPGDRGKDWE